MSHRLLEFDSLKEGTLVKRYKRFLADIELDDGTKITAHCPNTGPMRGLLNSNSRVRVSFSPSPTRKLSWTWQQVQLFSTNGDNVWVGINTLLANNLIRKAIENNLLYEALGEIDTIRSEVAYGKDKRSRIDFLVSPKSSNPDNRNIYIEVKNTTWSNKSCAFFPDTVTTRGQKHLKELISIMPSAKGILIPCITRTDINFFSSGDAADPIYGKLFRESVRKGLAVYPCSFKFARDHISWNGFIPLIN